ncbi:MAG: methionyl-tRNA formyltransferase [Verrucomicrobiota bacterium]|nr:methionyl-tRNA formyltransferase [Verrucomicrobiota bacterium]
MAAIRTAFFGSDEIALPLLETLRSTLQERVELVGIWTQPDKARGRGMKFEPNGIKLWAESRGLDIHQPEKIGTADHEWLKARGVELILVMAYGHILKNDLLALTQFPVLNFHASLLPQYRGASPINAAIAAGEVWSGVSLMQIVRKLDAGAVYGQELVPIEADDTAVALAGKLAQACVPLAVRVLPGILDGSTVAVPQDETKVSFTRLLAREDALLDFHAPAQELVNRVRALHPWPGAAAKLGEVLIKFGEVGLATRTDSATASPPIPGTVLESSPQVGLRLATGTGGALAIHSLQRPGGKMLAVKEFLRGYKIAEGSVFSSTPMKPLVQSTPFPRAVFKSPETGGSAAV